MVSYRLVYFNVKNKAEVSRLLFDIAGQPFEDKRVRFDQWENEKPKLPFLQAPVLEITENGQTIQIAQSHTINRYLARKFNLAGKNEIEMAQADMIIEEIIDTYNMLVKIYKEPDGEYKTKAINDAMETHVPQNLRLIQNILDANKSKSGYLVGNALTYADVYLMNFYDWLRDRKGEILSKLPLLKQHDEKIRSNPRIAEHLKKNSNVIVTILFDKLIE